ncbi:MAG: nicotinate-nucleotide adenylyltransferase [Bacillota bacterium]|jgi:nicotinate-nucleotide adenylyltransferase
MQSDKQFFEENAGNSNKKLKLGLMGGTFDPIHYGHLVAAEAARDKFELDKVIFIPSGNPPHKRKRVVSLAQHRVMMTVLATITNPFFSVSRIEVDRPGYSYAYDTVCQFLEHYHNSDIYFITGADAILEILSWNYIDELLKKCSFIAANRPGFNLKETKTLPAHVLKKVSFMEVPALAISSTDIRQRVAGGQTITYLLPEAVEMYIKKNGLYK